MLDNIKIRESNLGGENLSLNNNTSISGYIDKEFEFSHRVNGQKFYATTVRVMRLSGVYDNIPVIVSETLIGEGSNECMTDKFVKISGQFRSLNVYDEEQKSHLKLYLYAKIFEILEEKEFFKNELHVKGYICKKPIFRITPLGRRIADVMLAVNRDCNESDYLPCIFWAVNAYIVSDLQVGDKIEIFGRVQSRNYIKKHSEEFFEEKVAYEISVHDCLICEKE